MCVLCVRSTLAFEVESFLPVKDSGLFCRDFDDIIADSTDSNCVCDFLTLFFGKFRTADSNLL